MGPEHSERSAMASKPLLEHSDRATPVRPPIAPCTIFSIPIPSRVDSAPLVDAAPFIVSFVSSLSSIVWPVSRVGEYESRISIAPAFSEMARSTIPSLID